MKMFTPLLRLILVSVSAAALVAQSATISVDVTTEVRTVDARVFGVNATIWDSHASSDETIARLDEAGVRMIRVPGGSLSNEYHWRENRTRDNTWNWQTGFDGFVRLIVGLNAQASVSVNYGSGTPEEAAAWVAYANGATSGSGDAVNVTIGVDAKGYDWKTVSYWADLRAAMPLAVDDGMNFLRIGRAAPVGIKNWEIGNENYGSWEYDEQPAGQKYNAFIYATRAKDYIAAMKAVDSSIRVGVVAVASDTDYSNGYTAHPATNPRTGEVRHGWTPVLLSTLKTLGVTPDALVYHRYEQAPRVDQPQNPENDAKLLQSARTWPQDAASLREMAVDYLGASEAAKVELVVTENNSVYATPGKQTTSLVNGLFYADSIGHLLQTEFNAMIWWVLRNGGTVENANLSDSLYGWRNYGDYGIFATPADASFEAGFYDAHPTYYAMKQVANFARGGDTIIEASSDDGLLGAFAARRANGSVSVLVINKDPANDLEATIAFEGFVPAAVARRHFYGKPQDEAARTGSGSRDVESGDVGVNAAAFAGTFPSYSLTVLTFDPMDAAASATATYVEPGAQSVAAGGSVTFTAVSAVSGIWSYSWARNGTILGPVDRWLMLSNVQPAEAGLYQTIARGADASAGVSEPVILGVSSTSKVIGDGKEIEADIVHANGNVFDQVLVTGAAEAITADHAQGQITRTSFIDLTNDIVQVELSGAGTLSLVLEDASAPARPVNYNQAVDYVKGHARIVITDADETTNVAVFAVGRATALDDTGGFNFLLPISETNDPANNGSALFAGHDATDYDGVADIASIAILSRNGKFGSVRTGNAVYYATHGLTGIYAPGVEFVGPVYVGNIDAMIEGQPVLMIGSSPDTRITGGDLAQANGRAVRVAGLTRLEFTTGRDAHGRLLEAKANGGVLERNGVDVTAAVVATP